MGVGRNPNTLEQISLKNLTMFQWSLEIVVFPWLVCNNVLTELSTSLPEPLISGVRDLFLGFAPLS